MSDRFNPDDLHRKGFEPDGKGGWRKVRKSAEPAMADISNLLKAMYPIGAERIPKNHIVEVDGIETPSAFRVGIDPFKDDIASMYQTRNELPFPELIEQMANYYGDKILPEGSNRKIIILKMDDRNMEELAKGVWYNENGWEHGKPIPKNLINRTIKELHRLDAENLLSALKASEFYIAGEVRSTKNHKRILKRKDGTRFIGKADATMKAERVTAWDYNTQATKFKAAVNGKPFPLFLKFTFIMSTDANFDFNNLSQGPLDQMQKAGWLRNDNRRHVVPVFNPTVYIHPEKAGLVISIL